MLDVDGQMSSIFFPVKISVATKWILALPKTKLRQKDVRIKTTGSLTVLSRLGRGHADNLDGTSVHHGESSLFGKK